MTQISEAAQRAATPTEKSERQLCEAHGAEQMKIVDDAVYDPIRSRIVDEWIAAGSPMPKENWLYSRLVEARHKLIKVEIFQHDWMPGFAAFLEDGSVAAGAPAHVSLNVGAFISAVKTGDLDKADVPYFVAESIMHEVVHVLESWAGVEFSEDRVEELLAKYREKYERATIWEYTGAAPHEEEPVSVAASAEVCELREALRKMTNLVDIASNGIDNQWGKKCRAEVLKAEAILKKHGATL